LLRACEKTAGGHGHTGQIVDEVETRLADSPDRELAATAIGEMLMDRLKGLDKISYVRFASVYRDFQDVEAFLDELKNLMIQKRP
jgi:transcriptional repressor NrdR